MIGIVNFFASALSIWTARTFNRKTIFVVGHYGIGLAHIGVGICAYIGNNVGVLGGILAFVILNQNSTGCITWMYCSEVAVDVVLGFVGFTGYFVIFLLTLTTEFMMDSEFLKP